MGPKHLLGLFAFASLAAVARPARADGPPYPTTGPVTVTADPGPGIAISTDSTVTFTTDEVGLAGSVSVATTAGAITVMSIGAGSISLTTSVGGVTASGALTATLGAISVSSGNDPIRVAGLSLFSLSNSLNAGTGTINLSGTVSVPISTTAAPLSLTTQDTEATITLNLTGTYPAGVVAGTRFKVFTWPAGGGIRNLLVTPGTAPALTGLKLKYDQLDTGDVYVVSACGDGVLDTGEQCDDGNTRAGDGCSATCQKEPDAGVDAGHDAGTGSASDGGTDENGGADGGEDASDGAPSGPLPALGNIFGNDPGSGCAAAPDASDALPTLPAILTAAIAFLGIRRRNRR